MITSQIIKKCLEDMGAITHMEFSVQDLNGNTIAATAGMEVPDAEIVCIPLADGGDGTTEALTAAHHGEIRSITVSGPLGKPAESS